MGARPMQRLIQDSIRKILADELLFGKLKNGGSVKIEFDEQSEKIYLKWPKLNGGTRQDTKTSPESIEI
jgi:ATP-dependent Clp protease ATP-binding subunit ClpA